MWFYMGYIAKSGSRACLIKTKRKCHRWYFFRLKDQGQRKGIVLGPLRIKISLAITRDTSRESKKAKRIQFVSPAGDSALRAEPTSRVFEPLLSTHS